MSQTITENGGSTTGAQSASFTQAAYFAPSDYFLGVARKVIASGSDVQVTLPDRGEVIIAPARGAYFADIRDRTEFFRAPAADFKVGQIKKDSDAPLLSAGPAGHISELLWEAAFHASQGRLVGSRSNEEAVHLYDVIRFDHWPNLSRLSQTPNTMRICALLTRAPSSIMLVARKLGIDAAELYQVYSAACSYGIVTVVSSHLGQADVQANIDDDGGQSGLALAQGVIRALFAKITGL